MPVNFLYSASCNATLNKLLRAMLLRAVLYYIFLPFSNPQYLYNRRRTSRNGIFVIIPSFCSKRRMHSFETSVTRKKVMQS